MSASRAIGFAAVILLAPCSAAAAVTTVQDLQFGPVPVGTVHTIDATNGLYAGMWVGAFDAARPPCTTGGTGQVQFQTLPLQLTSGANSLNVSYGATSARVARQSDPNSYLEFNPTGGAVGFPISWFPVVLTLGGTATVSPAQAPGTYTGAIAPRIAYSRNIGGCNPFNQMSGSGAASLLVQPAMTVTALNGPIDLGQFFAGSSRIVAANGSSGTPARFSVQGPPALAWRLTVTTVDLLHASLPNTIPLSFTGGLYGTGTPPATAFASGNVVPSGSHGGGPLIVWLGYRADAGPAAPAGIYTGSLTLTVEGLLN